MAFQLAGEAAVAAFLRSVLRNLNAILARGDTTPFIINDFNPELEKLEKKMSWFQDLLVDGETRRLFEKIVDNWMDDLKDLVYDVDDILDDINCGSTQPGSVQVSDDLSHVFSSSNTIKGRLGKVLVRSDRLREEAEHLNLRRGIGSVSWVQSQPIRRRRETGPSIDKSEIHGREEDKKKIVDMLLEANGSTSKKYDVICIVGMGGLGKTTLAQLLYRDQEVARHFDVKSWACISDIFDFARAAKELIESSRQSGGGAHSLQSLPAMQDELERIVENKRILFVLDDVWTTTEWDKMKAPLSSCGNGSKILVTTRINAVALAMSNRSPYHLGVLDYEQCWAIFKDKAFGEIDVDDIDQELKKLGEEIVSKCGGIPLAVKVLGSMLRRAEVERWKAILENSLWNAAYENGEIHPAMRLSYHYLPARLKRCFEYFAVFPSDYKFDQVQLVRMWIAEGLIEEGEGRITEDIGNEYYNDLKGRSLIQENDMMHDIIHHLSCMVSKKFCYRVNSCEPHASMRHASYVGCFADEIDDRLFAEAHSLRTLILDGDIVSKLEDKIWSCKMLRVLNLSGGGYISDLAKVPRSIGDLKHLRYLLLESTIMSYLPDSICMLSNLQVLDLGKCHLENLPNNLNYLSNLRCLILHSAELSSLPDSICMLSNLQVLDLGKCPLENLPNNLNYLLNLRCLILRYSKLSSLPESVCSLCKLQVLDLGDCKDLQKLPKDIGNLQSLQILKLRWTPAMLPESIVNITGLQKLKVDHFKELPPYIGRLSRLQVLPAYHVGKDKGRGIDELRDMNMLKGKLIIFNMENIEGVVEASRADLKSKKHIRELEFYWEERDNYDAEMKVKIIEALQPHDALQSLEFFFYGGNRLPVWIMSSLRNLTHLVMADLEMVSRMVGMEFASLIELRIESCPTLSEVLMATPKLRKLEVSFCRKLQAASFVLLPSLVSDSSDLHLIIAQLEDLKCPCHVFEHFIQQLEAANSCCTKLKILEVTAIGVGVASLPRGWPSILKSLETLEIRGIDEANFQLLPDGDGSPNFPPSLRTLNLNHMAGLPSDLCNLTSLRSLQIYNFPGLVSFEIQELPPDLQSFSISRCPCLTKLPELPPDLQSFSISRCPCLTKLPDGFAYLTSLKEVYVNSCPNLVIFKDEMIPPTAKFYAYDCDRVV